MGASGTGHPTHAPSRRPPRHIDTKRSRPPQRADVAYLGVGQLGIQSEEYVEAYWTETVRAVGARCVVLIHWDDFFRPLPMTPDDPVLRALPYAGDDLDATLRVLGGLAVRDRVALRLPTVWDRQDPWR